MQYFCQNEKKKKKRKKNVTAKVFFGFMLEEGGDKEDCLKCICFYLYYLV